jgi:uncharacterized protein (TIGR02145 family)
MKKNLFQVLAAVVAFAIFSIACKKDDVPVTGISFEKTTETLQVGQTLTLTPIIAPTNATNKNVTWESDALTVATVFDGVVTAVSPGVAIITAFSVEKPELYAEFTLTVTREPHPVLGTISTLTLNEWTIGEGANRQIWSDAILVQNALTNQADFDGGSRIAGDMNSFKASILRNPDYGDLFSWQAVEQYKNVLCPAPWRVPSSEDFEKLDVLLGGTGLPNGNPSTGEPNEQAPQALYNAYVNTWGAKFGGFVSGTDGIMGKGENSSYWSTTENQQSGEVQPHGMAFGLGISNKGMELSTFQPDGFDAGNPATGVCPPGSWSIGPGGCMGMTPVDKLTTIPASNIGKSTGYQVRCVR